MRLYALRRSILVNICACFNCSKVDGIRGIGYGYLTDLVQAMVVNTWTKAPSFLFNKEKSS